MKVLVVDDEDSLRTLMGRLITAEGYEACFAADGLEALEAYERERPDLIVLDVMMPKLDGFEVCQRLRDQGATVPIVFLSAKDQLSDKGAGFGAGGDDYVTKPFSAKELTLRIKARLQQHERAARKPAGEPTPEIELDARMHRVMVGGRRVELTAKEFQILQLLAEHPGEVFTREQIIAEVWGEEFVGETTSIAVFVRRIREKIEEDPSHPRFLQTVLRVGYKFGD